MEIQVRTPQAVFMQPPRLMVPPFQRPYVLNEENQWEQHWKYIARVADQLASQSGVKHKPHFLGALVLQQVQNASDTMQERIIIDGQKRIRTLQPLFDALHLQIVAVNAEAAAIRMAETMTSSTTMMSNPRFANAKQLASSTDDQRDARVVASVQSRRIYDFTLLAISI